MAETDTGGPFIKWLQDNDLQYNLNDSSVVYDSEISLVRQIFNFKPIRDAVKMYFDDLGPIFLCDAAESEKLRRKANLLYRQGGKLEDAALLYTRAIYKAPLDSLCLPRAHANRATVLYKLQSYEEAYEDLTCALELHHPLAQAILSRQAAIAWKLKSRRKMQDCLQRFNSMNFDVPVMIRNFHEKLESSGYPLENPDSLASSKLPKFNNIKLSRSVERGRFYIANKPVEAGELIMEDTAAVLIPNQDGLFQNMFLTPNDDVLVFTCDNCAKDDIVPFACYDCRAVFYCSNKCRQEHFSIHKFECSGYKIGLFNHDVFDRLGFRCMVKTFDHVLHSLHNLDEINVIKTAEELWPIILKTGKDGELLGLYNNLNRFQEHNNALEHALTSFSICYYLSHHTNFFEETRLMRSSIMPVESDWHIVVTALLLHFTAVSVFNSLSGNIIHPRVPFADHAYENTGLYATIVPDSVFTGIYPWFSFFDHSCDSNTVIRHNNSTVSVFSKRHIPKGDEVTFDYLYDSTKMNRDQRHAALKHYFDCDCTRCINDDDPIYVKSMGIPCKCGGVYLLEEDDSSCTNCGERCIQEVYYNSFLRCSEQEDSPVTFTYLYGACTLLLKSLENNAISTLCKSLANTLEKYIFSKSVDVVANEQINSFMVKLGINLLEVSGKNNIPEMDRITYAALLLDLLSMRRKAGYHEINFNHEKLFKRALWAATGKPKKMFEDSYKLNCT